jgi:hypothetical protein
MIELFCYHFLQNCCGPNSYDQEIKFWREVSFDLLVHSFLQVTTKDLVNSIPIADKNGNEASNKAHKIYHKYKTDYFCFFLFCSFLLRI